MRRWGSSGLRSAPRTDRNTTRSHLGLQHGEEERVEVAPNARESGRAQQEHAVHAAERFREAGPVVEVEADAFEGFGAFDRAGRVAERQARRRPPARRGAW
jgi:hypothetical protein